MPQPHVPHDHRHLSDQAALAMMRSATVDIRYMIHRSMLLIEADLDLLRQLESWRVLIDGRIVKTA
jgi:hypothetical protein